MLRPKTNDAEKSFLLKDCHLASSDSESRATILSNLLGMEIEDVGTDLNYF